MTDSIFSRRQVLSAAGISIVGLGMSGQAAASSHDDQPRAYSAELTGDEQVPPVETDASGHATFEVDEDRREVHYEVHIDFICNPNQAHIHLGDRGENGPVVAWLYPEDRQEPELIEGRFAGTLAEGTLTEDDLVGPLEGASPEEAAERMDAEGVYVNVHTEQYPDGEIRGQIVPDEEPVEEPEPDEPEEPEEEEEPEVDPSDALEVSEVNNEGTLPEEENIVLTNTSDQDIDMTGFQIRDREGATVDDRPGTDAYVFGDFILGAGNSVTVWSGEGTDDGDNVYWGQSGENQQIWSEEGDTVIVLDADGNEVLRYEYNGGQPALALFQFVRSLFI